jgi:hypothetical protein
MSSTASTVKSIQEKIVKLEGLVADLERRAAKAAGRACETEHVRKQHIFAALGLNDTQAQQQVAELALVADAASREAADLEFAQIAAEEKLQALKADLTRAERGALIEDLLAMVEKRAALGMEITAAAQALGKLVIAGRALDKSVYEVGRALEVKSFLLDRLNAAEYAINWLAEPFDGVRAFDGSRIGHQFSHEFLSLETGALAAISAELQRALASNSAPTEAA